MSDTPPMFRLLVVGESSGRDGWVYDWPMERSPLTGQWVIPQSVSVEQYPDGLYLGTLVQVRDSPITGPNGSIPFRWVANKSRAQG